MTGLTPLRVVQERIKRSNELSNFKRKALTLRRVLMGDWSQVDGVSAAAISALGTSRRRGTSGSTASEAYLEDDNRWLLNTALEVGVSNEILLNVRTLAMQASIRTPDIGFESAEPDSQMFLGSYIKQIFGRSARGCAAADEMTLGLLHYMSDGVSWRWNTVTSEGVPCMRSVDTLDVRWEPTAQLPTHVSWIALDVTRTAGEWALIYDKDRVREAALETMRGGDPEEWQDVLLTVVMYWDKETDDGTHYALFVDDAFETRDVAVWDEGPNPHYSEADRYRRAVLPLDPMYFLVLPSTLGAVSIVEAMVPTQLSAAIMERFMQTTALRGVPRMVSEAGALSEEAKEALEGNEPMELIEFNPGKTPPHRLEASGIPREMLAIYERQVSKMQQMGGVNPYATGGRNEDVDFAAEVDAIRASSSLMATQVSSDVAQAWARSAKAALENARYDVVPRKLMMDGVPVWFGAGMPGGLVYDVIDQDAVPTVSEDAMQFASRAARIGFYRQLLEIASNETVSRFAPASAAITYRKLLAESGERNIGQHFDMAGAVPMAAMQEADVSVPA